VYKSKQIDTVPSEILKSLRNSRSNGLSCSTDSFSDSQPSSSSFSNTEFPVFRSKVNACLHEIHKSIVFDWFETVVAADTIQHLSDAVKFGFFGMQWNRVICEFCTKPVHFFRCWIWFCVPKCLPLVSLHWYTFLQRRHAQKYLTCSVLYSHLDLARRREGRTSTHPPSY